MSVDKICQGIASCINNHKGVQKTLEKIGDNPAMFSAMAAFGMASILRPMALDALPFKNDKDRKCSKASAISSGLVDLATTAAIFIPLSKGLDKASAKLLGSKGTFYFENSKAVEQFKSITNRSLKLMLLFPVNMLRMKLIKPLINKMTEKEEMKKKRKLDKWA